MKIYLQALRSDNGENLYRMLQELPAEENGFTNPIFGRAYAEFRQWLAQCAAAARQKGLADGWKVRGGPTGCLQIIVRSAWEEYVIS